MIALGTDCSRTASSGKHLEEAVRFIGHQNVKVYAPNPAVFPPRVWVNGQPASSVQYVADPDLLGTFTATVIGQPVEFGTNRLGGIRVSPFFSG